MGARFLVLANIFRIDLFLPFGDHSAIRLYFGPGPAELYLNYLFALLKFVFFYI
jgi:hypothetical protein